jgi:hypothetical protein
VVEDGADAAELLAAARASRSAMNEMGHWRPVPGRSACVLAAQEEHASVEEAGPYEWVCAMAALNIRADDPKSKERFSALLVDLSKLPEEWVGCFVLALEYMLSPENLERMIWQRR